MIPDHDNEKEEVDEKPRTLFVGNVPPSVKKRDLEILFGDIGPLKRCHLQYPKKSAGKDTSEPLVAYITYALTEDATAAVEKFSSYRLQRNKLNIKLIKSRAGQHRVPGAAVSGSNAEPVIMEAESRKKTKQPRQKRNVKKSRLIIRNISFQTTEEKLREHFSKCGTITDVNILKKRDGKLVGCAFVQYENVHGAFKALKELNGHPFLGRPVVIDWAVPKDKYESASKEAPEVVVKSEPEDSEDDVKIKTEKEAEDDLLVEKESDDEDENDVDDKEGDSDEETNQPPRVRSEDADEGKTLFIRNLSFDTTKEDLKTFFEKFGDLNYALICIDSLTEHSKGTGFVKFKDLESAQSCLRKFEEDSSEFSLNDRQFYVNVALSKGKLEEKLNSGKQTEQKDNRHLYLSREGFIRPGSEAALGVSVADMNKRATLHQKKKQLLKDLSVFVSETRLCVHNLPPTLTDQNLKKIFLKHAGPGAEITEARIMRDMSTIKRVSKEFGFVNFTTHVHALTALRSINNNPAIFTANRRPIVEFSLENRKAIRAKEARLLKSQEKVKLNVSEMGEHVEEGKRLSKKEKRKLRRKIESETNTGVTDSIDDAEEEAEDEPTQKKVRKSGQVENVPEFGGLVGKKGVTSLPAMKAKGKITRKSLKLTKKKVKRLERRPREPKSVAKGKSRDDTDNIDNFISKRKQETSKIERKWFD